LHQHAGAVPFLDHGRVLSFIERRLGLPARRCRVAVSPLRGGLTSQVARVRVQPSGSRAAPFSFVVKRAEGEQKRELAAYRMYLAQPGLAAAPRLLGAASAGPNASYMFLEWVASSQRWPWRDSNVAGLVLEQLARVHTRLSAARFSTPLTDWDYESDLIESARATLEAFVHVARVLEFPDVRRRRRALERTVAALPAIRRHLLAAERVVLHGDAHPGNAIIRGDGAGRNAVLLDWGRVRLGSPVEDVASWLHSLGFWEPEARRRHDTLLRRYLAARGLPTTLTRSFRDLCWLAGASNALSGALRYHLEVLAATQSDAARFHAAGAVRDWLRVIRRADACWRA
jgi:aminoglycoside phosphotransferase (APT) family kinase protein